MQTWFHNTWVTIEASSTSEALDKAYGLASPHERKELSVLSDRVKEGVYNVRYGLIGVQASTPLEAYKILKAHLTEHTLSTNIDTYTIQNGLTEFPVSKFLEPLT